MASIYKDAFEICEEIENCNFNEVVTLVLRYGRDKALLMLLG